MLAPFPGVLFCVLPFSGFQCLFCFLLLPSLKINTCCFLYCYIHLEQCLAYKRSLAPFYSVNEWIMNLSVHWRSKLPKCRLHGTDFFKDEERKEISKAVRYRLSKRTRENSLCKCLPFKTILPIAKNSEK